jgi:hypothetical protein
MKDLVKNVLHALRWRWEDQRGAALMVAAGSMVALVSAIALAVDVGMLTVARTESQRVADGSALAGAGALILSPDNVEFATSEAMEFALKNTIQGNRARVRAEDVLVDTDRDRVTVQVLRHTDRNNPVGTFFARIFGVNSVNIVTTATAQASPAAGINCLLPVALPDRWHEEPGNDVRDYNPEDGDYYVPWQNTDTDPISYNENFTGYSADDIGDQITIKSNIANGDLNPFWYYVWRPPGQSGAEDYRTNVNSCVDPSIQYGVGTEVDPEPGDMRGPTLQGFSDLVASDPTAVWNSQMNCITDATDVLSNDGGDCRASSRMRPIPLFDPTKGPVTASDSFSFTNFAGVFVEGIVGNDVIIRWIGYTALRPASEDDVTAGPQFKVLQLVE